MKQRYALLPMSFNFALVYVIRRVQINQVGLKLKGTHQLLVYADDVYVCMYIIYICMCVCVCIYIYIRRKSTYYKKQ